MKIAFVVHHELASDKVMQLLKENGIDYYTCWEKVKGKGRGSEPHLGTGSFGAMNSVLMIAFQEEGPLEKLIQAIDEANKKITRRDDQIRLFQVPLERIV